MGTSLVSYDFICHLTVHVTAAYFSLSLSSSCKISSHSWENLRGLLVDQEAEWFGDETQIIYHKNNNKERYAAVKFAISEHAFINSVFTKLSMSHVTFLIENKGSYPNLRDCNHW